MTAWIPTLTGEFLLGPVAPLVSASSFTTRPLITEGQVRERKRKREKEIRKTGCVREGEKRMMSGIEHGSVPWPQSYYF